MHLDTQALGSLYEMSRDAVICVKDELIVYANPAAQALFNRSPGEKASLCIPDHILAEPAERFIASAKIGDRRTDVAVVRLEELTIVTVMLRGEPDPFPAGDGVLKELGEELLNVRLAFDGVLSDQNPSGQHSVYADTLYQSYYRLKRLYNHLTLLHSGLRDHMGRALRMIDLDEVLSGLCASVAPMVRDRGVELQYQGPEGECYLPADPTLMETMLLNLLTNSLLHTEKGVTIKVTLSVIGSRAVIAVDDPGSGIRPDKLSAVIAGFPEPELTDASAGAGLGIAVVRGIAELHGGTLFLGSNPGHGTRMRISLPMSAPDRRLCQPEVRYKVNGMDLILTEMSVVLDKSIYTQKLFD